MGKINMRYMPTPNREYSKVFANLTGGINTWDPPFGLEDNESPHMRNLIWRGGMLCSRGGQYYVCPYTLGTGYAAYPKLWHGYIFAHIAGNIYRFDASDGSPVLLATGVPKIRGTFFTYGEKLYYKTKGAYKEITATLVDDQWSFSCNDVFPYEPVILINASPSNGSGDLYQPENRMSSRKTVWYNAVAGATTYYLPVKATRVTYVEVNGYHVTSGWTYDPQYGRVIFTVAPPVTDPPTSNGVRITYELDNVAAQKSIDDCRYATTYGGTGELCVVMAGAEAQPNAYYWSGNSSIKMDPSYFPMEQAQLAGSSDERITGFGKQQNDLIIFKEDSVGKTTLGTQVINDRVYIDMPYTSINASIGCDKPWSIQLVENNLVFANKRGVYMVQDTTPANENNIVQISRKVNGDESPHVYRGLVEDINTAREDEVCSIDDGHNYYLMANGATWLWNYELSTYKKPSWFMFSNTFGVALIADNTKLYHVDNFGRLSSFHEPGSDVEGVYSDYGQPIDRLFTFPVMIFGHDRRVNVNSVIIGLGGYSLEKTRLMYMTEYENWEELTPLEIVEAERFDGTRKPGTRPEASASVALFRRRPMARRITHYSMQLYNNNIDEDFELVSAQVFYNFQGRLR